MTETGLRFEDLSPEAKERARDKQRSYLDDWWDYVFEDAVECGRLLGIEISNITRHTMNNKTVEYPAIYFELHHRGAGVTLKGKYRKPKNMMGILGHAPNDKELVRLAERLVALQTSTFLVYNDHLGASIDTSGNYNSLSIEVYSMDEEPRDSDRQDTEPTEVEVRELKSIIHDFASWIYKQLNAEYDYLNSDECIDEQLTDYTFDEDGSIL